MASPPPRIFSPARRRAVRARMLQVRQRPGAARHLIDELVADVVERIGFLRHEPVRMLAIGDAGECAAAFSAAAVTSLDPAHGFDEAVPFIREGAALSGFDTVVSLGTLDTVDDLPGALLHLRAALAPGGLAIASFVGAGSLPRLRAAMLSADGDRPAPRLHPMVDVRAAGQLLLRAGWQDPVVDGWPVWLHGKSPMNVVRELRHLGLGNVLANPGPAFRDRRIIEQLERSEPGFYDTIEIVTLTGWRR